ncbi:MAG: TlpA family protein disulfide reductase [bacterium]|nr:TlpA family protein disulfide reductase [bacterium]
MRDWRLPIGLWVAALVFAAAVYVRHGGHAGIPVALRPPRVGAHLPTLTATTLGGTDLRIAGLRGHPVWINFFASWCPPCNAEMPRIVARERTLRRRGLVVVGLDQQENPALVRRFMHLYGIRFPVYIDGGGIAGAFGVNGLPVSVFVDRHGVIQAIRYGELDRSEMDGDLAAILGA